MWPIGKCGLHHASHRACNLQRLNLWQRSCKHHATILNSMSERDVEVGCCKQACRGSLSVTSSLSSGCEHSSYFAAPADCVFQSPEVGACE